MRLEIITGQVYGKLTVIREAEKLTLPCGQINRTVLCKCSCGNEKVVRLAQLIRGRVKSCGCQLHGWSRTKLHNTWRAMMARVRSDNHINHNRYKDRGITVCKEWQKFIPFKEWALSHGWRDGLTLDRIDNNGNYSPSNCRFVTQVENANNREITTKIEYNGNLVSLSLLLHQKNIRNHYPAILGRIKRGWVPQEAVDTPIRKGNYR